MHKEQYVMDARLRSARREKRNYAEFVKEKRAARHTHADRVYDRAGVEGKEVVTGPYHTANIERQKEALAAEQMAAMGRPQAAFGARQPNATVPTRTPGGFSVSGNRWSSRNHSRATRIHPPIHGISQADRDAQGGGHPGGAFVNRYRSHSIS